MLARVYRVWGRFTNSMAIVPCYVEVAHLAISAVYAFAASRVPVHSAATTTTKAATTSAAPAAARLLLLVLLLLLFWSSSLVGSHYRWCPSLHICLTMQPS